MDADYEDDHNLEPWWPREPHEPREPRRPRQFREPTTNQPRELRKIRQLANPANRQPRNATSLATLRTPLPARNPRTPQTTRHRRGNNNFYNTSTQCWLMRFRCTMLGEILDHSTWYMRGKNEHERRQGSGGSLLAFPKVNVVTAQNCSSWRVVLRSMASLSYWFCCNIAGGISFSAFVLAVIGTSHCSVLFLVSSIFAPRVPVGKIQTPSVRNWKPQKSRNRSSSCKLHSKLQKS